MEHIKTYQDFLDVGSGERERTAFLLAAISEHQGSPAYKEAVDAELYYRGENPTIARYEKIIYDLKGRAHLDMYTANHKIASSFFGFAVDQEASYLLGNGVTFKKADTKGRLGTLTLPFDRQVMKAAREALIGGVAYGFINLDHVEIYSVREFIPLVDEESGAIKAGIRFWQLDNSKPLRVTLFELDGYTDYIRRSGQEITVLTPKRPYIVRSVGSQVDRDRGEAISEFENYPGFPVVPLAANDELRSELRGKRNTLDALDLATSNMVNNVDEGNLIYWVINNAGGMDDLDDVKFLERLRLTKVAHVDNGQTAEPHTIEAPYVGTSTTIDMLIKRLYTDFQAFDASAVTAGNQTATAIKASYVPLDLKTDKFEEQVTKFIGGLLSLAGIDDVPSYTRNQIINKSEEAQTVLLGAQYFDSEYITRKLLTILGDADLADEILKRQAAENLKRYEPDGGTLDGGTQDEPEDEPDGAEVIDNAED